jgi:hypothetical protein
MNRACGKRDARSVVIEPDPQPISKKVKLDGKDFKYGSRYAQHVAAVR